MLEHTTVENPVMGRPYVIVRTDTARFMVTVVEHCRSLRDAKQAVEEMTVKGSSVINHIVSSLELELFLKGARQVMAEIMVEEMLS